MKSLYLLFRENIIESSLRRSCSLPTFIKIVENNGIVVFRRVGIEYKSSAPLNSDIVKNWVKEYLDLSLYQKLKFIFLAKLRYREIIDSD